MTEEDKDLEKLKVKRLKEMQNNISFQQKQTEIKSSQDKQQKINLTNREFILQKLGYRGLEVLQNAEYQFPNETKILIDLLRMKQCVAQSEDLVLQ